MHLTKENVKSLLFLHVLLFGYSLGGICSKLAAKQEFLSLKFLMFYAVVLAVLMIYAILWQQVLKRLPLVTAYANKAVTVIWGIVWGHFFFQEPVTINKMIGAVVIIIGVYFVVSEKEEAEA